MKVSGFRAQEKLVHGWKNWIWSLQQMEKQHLPVHDGLFMEATDTDGILMYLENNN